MNITPATPATPRHRMTVYTPKYHTSAGTLTRMGYTPRRTKYGYTGRHHKDEKRAA